MANKAISSHTATIDPRAALIAQMAATLWATHVQNGTDIPDLVTIASDILHIAEQKAKEGHA